MLITQTRIPTFQEKSLLHKFFNVKNENIFSILFHIALNKNIKGGPYFKPDNDKNKYDFYLHCGGIRNN